ncbi:DNA translocase FtsK [Alkalihalobacillus sp. CinArs1]|uniref:DNA translocase FtsK n=1 Tax=Alkalihalobacillus sp. CinArs1 TaxID=2995314 RepID=UPI0022DD245B|nr:DNA translocase FtsK [Alkalihalobacillus sp. CinArs1]
MGNNWFKKALNKLFDVNEEKEMDDRADEGARQSKEYPKIDRKNSIGRIESGTRKNEARIVHQYPREGNFRFPLIPDESYKSGRRAESKKTTQQPKPADSSDRSHKTKNENSNVRAVSNSSSSSNQNKAKTSSEQIKEDTPKKFSGVNFKPTDIPSPIYGFSKRPVVEKVERAIKESEYRHKYTPLNEHKVIDQLIHKPTDYRSEESEIRSYDLKNEHTEEVKEDKPLSSTEPNKGFDHTDEANHIEEVLVSNYEEDNQAEDTTEGIENDAPQSDRDSEREFDESPLRKELENDDQKDLEPLNDQGESSGSYIERAIQASESPVEIEDEVEIHEEVTEEQEDVQEELIEEVLGKEQEDGQEDTPEETQEEVLEDGHEEASEKDIGTHSLTEVDDKETLQNVSEVSAITDESKESQAETVEESGVTQKHKENKVEKKREEGRPKPQVPYNVMMLASDRRHLVKKPTSNGEYKLPPISLLDIPPRDEGNDEQWLKDQRELLESTLKNFNVQASVIGATMGPTVTRFEVQPSPGVKVNKITNLSDDIKLSLAARDIRMEAPIPGRNAIGIEVPNPRSRPVFIREVVRSGVFQSKDSLLNAALGFDIGGNAKVTDIQKMPHGLIAGATGSGKSVCINSILVSLLLNSNPADVKMLLIDPKMVELAPYNGLPHLVTPVINDVKEATTALKWAVDEMEERYEKFAAAGVRDIKRYNDRAIEHGEPQHKLPYIVVVIDELADLMMVSPQDVEDAICRIAQKARACGIHLLVATQRPSVDVITGLIKANIPTRIAFSVSSQIDSRTILDSSGAEKLLGKGDMLCLENGSSKPVRLQGNFVSDEEIERVTSYVRKQRKPNYLIAKEDLAKKQQYNEQEDDLFEEACMWAIDQGQASSSALQRRFRIGFNRAARLIEMMEERGLVSEAMGSKPRSILMSKADFEETFLKDMHV